MQPAATGLELAASSKGFARRLMTIGENRLEQNPLEQLTVEGIVLCRRRPGQLLRNLGRPSDDRQWKHT